MNCSIKDEASDCEAGSETEISFSVDRKTNICLPIVLANMEYLRSVILSCFITCV